MKNARSSRFRRDAAVPSCCFISELCICDFCSSTPENYREIPVEDKSDCAVGLFSRADFNDIRRRKSLFWSKEPFVCLWQLKRLEVHTMTGGGRPSTPCLDSGRSLQTAEQNRIQRAVLKHSSGWEGAPTCERMGSQTQGGTHEFLR
jgi:hypothetical protein